MEPKIGDDSGMTMNRLIASGAIAVFALLGTASTAAAAPVGCRPVSNTTCSAPSAGNNAHTPRVQTKAEKDRIKQLGDDFRHSLGLG
jgi:cytochrome c5